MESRSPGVPLAIISILAVVIRLGLFFVYEPVAYSDTASYRRLAEAVQNSFQRYDGTRTPGYPAFLALIGADQRVYLAQLLLGLLITMLLFWIGWRLTANGWLARMVALAHTLNLGQLFFEANLLTETLTTFWVVLSLAATLLLLTRKTPSILISAGIGLFAALAALTRPLFIYLPFWLLLIVVWHAVQSSSRESPSQGRLPKWIGALFSGQVWAVAIAMLVPMALLLGSWVYYIHDHYHMWSLSTMTGYHMIQHSGNFFEYLPDEHAELRDTYLKHRQAHIDEAGTQTNTIWKAIPEMQEVSGLTFYDLSRTLSRLSIWLFVRHPGMYLENVLKGWWLFWRAPVFWQAEAFRWSFLAGMVPPLILFERGILVISNLIFVTTSLFTLFMKRLRPEGLTQRLFNWCLVGTIWIGSIVQSLLDHGDNPRFLVPMQSLVVMWLLWSGYRIWVANKKKA